MGNITLFRLIYGVAVVGWADAALADWQIPYLTDAARWVAHAALLS